MLTISAQEVDRLLTHAGLVETLRDAFRAGAVQPLRQHHHIDRPGGAGVSLLLMPAWSDLKTQTAPRDGHLGVKIVSVAPDNSAIGKPSVMGVYLLFDATTGEPQALIDGQRLTLWRTSCASALAADYLARKDARRLLVVGAGALSPFLARAHAAVRPIQEIRVWNRTPERAEAVAAGLRKDGFEASATDALDASVGWADVISAATISSEPLIRGEFLRPGVHVDLVGAFSPGMRESDDEAVRRARVYVDTRAGAMKEAGDIVQPLASGVITADDIMGDLYDLTRGAQGGRRSDDEITLFKSVGAAIEDLAAGVSVYRLFRANGSGGDASPK